MRFGSPICGSIAPNPLQNEGIRTTLRLLQGGAAQESAAVHMGHSLLLLTDLNGATESAFRSSICTSSPPQFLRNFFANSDSEITSSSAGTKSHELEPAGPDA